MNKSTFYERIGPILGSSPIERYQGMRQFHSEIVEQYQAGIGALSVVSASRVVVGDGRTVAQVVGHIAEWERFLIMAAGEMLAGVCWPRIMVDDGYVDLEGNPRQFKGVDDFNAFQAERQVNLSWTEIQSRATNWAQRLYALYSAPGLITLDLLEATKSFTWRLSSGPEYHQPCGWCLWAITLEHEGAEHADLWEGTS
jgi:hypothetical protein